MLIVLCLKYHLLLNKLQDFYNKLILDFIVLFVMLKFINILILLIRNFGYQKDFVEVLLKILYLHYYIFMFIQLNLVIQYLNFYLVVMLEVFITLLLLLLEMSYLNQMQEKFKDYRNVRVLEMKKIGLYIVNQLVNNFHWQIFLNF